MICSLNALSLLKHKDEIEMLLHDNKIDILALNETKLDETISKCHTKIDGYNHEQYDHNRHGRGVCIYLKSSIDYEVVAIASHQDGLELISLEIKPKCAKSFILIAWYRPPKHDISSIHKIKDVCQALDIRQKEIIILGDTNCDDLPDKDKNTVIKNLSITTSLPLKCGLDQQKDHLPKRRKRLGTS